MGRWSEGKWERIQEKHFPPARRVAFVEILLIFTGEKIQPQSNTPKRMSTLSWPQPLRTLFFQALEKYRSGERGADTFFGANENETLAAVGLRPIHVYDFVEDMAGGAAMFWEDFLLMAAARRDYFLYMMNTEWPGDHVPEAQLPLREDAWEGTAWLPRITAKARCFLQGSLDPSVMFYCGGDRQFLQSVDLHPADFLRAIWGARNDDAKVIRFVQGLRPSLPS